jgi:hypothetical protein
MFETPKTDWSGNDPISYEAFQRMEKNIKYLQVLLG